MARTVTAQTTAAWLASFKGGANRPMFRGTIQRLNVRALVYDLEDVAANNSTTLKELGGTGKFRTMMFGQDDQPIELPNMSHVSYSKGTDDAATVSVTLFNCEILPLGQTPEDSEYFERPGYFTPNRGDSAEAVDRWGYSPNGWQDMLLPDRVVRLYEGYGYDALEPPETDPHLYPAGVWMIDEVTFTTAGEIVLKCRDYMRVLLELIAYPPIVPKTQYPVYWERFRTVDNPDTITTADVVTTKSEWFTPGYDTDSGAPYIGRGLMDGKRNYVESDGSVHGHHGRDAFDTSGVSYWLSVGDKKKSSRSSYEYIQGKFTSRTVTGVQANVWAGPYKMYVSVFANGKWQGRSKIPYRADEVDTNADIPFVKAVTVGKGRVATVALPAAIAKATKVRLTFTGLFHSAWGDYKYRAGVQAVRVLKTTSSVNKVTTTVDGGTHIEGNYADYTDIVKWWLAWAGFYWPSNASGLAYQTYSDGSHVVLAPLTNDPIFPSGRAWGDFETTGTNGPATLQRQLFDKKPIMEAIAHVRDIVAYNFFVDETGGAIFRSPNIWQIGNYLSPVDGGPNVGRTSTVLEIDERETLLGMAVTLSSKNVREKIFVANEIGSVGAIVTGYNPAPSGLERVSGWTDQNFLTATECRIMAELIALRQKQSYRSNSVTIPGNPALQPDDQVYIYERMTAESYLHYVRAISCEWDLRSGQYHYTLSTNWLGTPAVGTTNVQDVRRISPETLAYLKARGWHV